MNLNNYKKNYFFVKYGLLIIFVIVLMVFMGLEMLKIENVSILQRIIDYFLHKPIQ